MGFINVYLYRASDKGGAPGATAGAVGLTNTPEESVLIRRLQQGKLKALGQLFDTHKDMVYRTALAITRDRRAAEDILQECFVRLYTYAASVDAQRPLKPWLYRVTVNLSYDWSAKKPLQPLDEILEWLSGLPSAFPSPDNRAEQKELMGVVRQVIDELPQLHRVVIVLFYLENLSLHEISQVLELPLGTVKSRLFYARERLRNALKQSDQTVPEMQYEFT
ncbi:MAG: sigma-70 family RNA polymerase sigma factor [Anaerolineae bacterium]|nr:sigma-70 family RNA polymerase sigma factor [Anaerolineae bacterium]